MMEVLYSGYHLSQEPIVPVLCLGVCQGSGTSRRSGQDAGKMHLGTGRSSGPRLLQSSVSDAEGVGGVMSHD